MKKVISAVLGVSMAASLAVGLTGCTGGGSDKLVWICLGDKPADHDTVMAKANEIIKPELGLEIDIQYIDSASYNEKTKMKMASKDPYDLIFAGYVNNYNTAVENGALYDITDLMDNIQMSDGTVGKLTDVVKGYFLESAMVDGRIYGIPNVQVVSNPSTFSMKKSVADECGFDAEGLQKLAVANNGGASTKAYLDKVTAEFAKIKAKRPDLYVTNPGGLLGTTNVYESIAGGVAIRRDGTSTELVIAKQTEEGMASIDALHDWYKAGYIRTDIASKGNTISSKDEYNQYATWTTTWKPGQDAQFIEDFGEEPVYTFIAEPYVARNASLMTTISVGANSKHPEEAVKLIYMLHTNEELYNLICWGIEGVHYTKNADGSVTQIADSGYKDIGRNAWKYGNQFNALRQEGQAESVWADTEKMNDEAVKSPLIGFVPNTESIATELANISNIDAEYKARIEYGTAPRAEYWDEYCRKLDEAGIQKVKDELQKQVDEFLASKQ